MKNTFITLFLGLAIFIPSLHAAPEAVTEVVRSTERDLTESLKELSGLRETMAAEKVPMTKELNRFEDRLSELRKQYEDSSRSLDGRNLDAANLKAEIKVRQEETAYLGNLMDEYARGFEGRVNISEVQRYAAVVEAAKTAPQNVDLSLMEKFNRQLALLKTSVARLDELVGGTRFPGTAVDPQGMVAQGTFAMIGPVVLFASENGKVAGLALPQSGSTKPAVRPLDELINPGLAAVVNKGEGLLPLDPSRGGALKELVARGSLVGYFKKGGPIMWPLLLASIFAVAVVIERLIFLAIERGRRNPRAVQAILGEIEQGRIENAIKVGKKTKDFVARVLTYGLMHREKSMANALMRAAAQEINRYNRGISFLDTIITMAPLLGLLGTVTGMMNSFGMLGGAELAAPAAITGGIAEALIATAFGLGIAITALVPLNYLHNASDRARHEMEDASSHLELLMKPILEVESHLAQQNLVEHLSRANGGSKPSNGGTEPVQPPDFDSPLAR